MNFIKHAILKFAAQCNPKKRGRPMSKSPKEAEAQGIEVCEQKTHKGNIVAYKTGEQRKKEKEHRFEKQQAKEKLGIKAKGRISNINKEKMQGVIDEIRVLKNKLPSLNSKKVKDFIAAKTDEAYDPYDPYDMKKRKSSDIPKIEKDEEIKREKDEKIKREKDLKEAKILKKQEVMNYLPSKINERLKSLTENNATKRSTILDEIIREADNLYNFSKAVYGRDIQGYVTSNGEIYYPDGHPYLERLNWETEDFESIIPLLDKDIVDKFLKSGGHRLGLWD